MGNRDHDLAQLRNDYKTASGRDKREIVKAGNKIRRETGAVKGMREALVREHRAGRVENVKDIHEYAKNKRKYNDY